METIMIMAQALAKASGLNILRLDIQYNKNDYEYSGYLNLGRVEFRISEDGTVEKCRDLKGDKRK